MEFTQPPTKCVKMALCPGEKRQERGADHSPQCLHDVYSDCCILFPFTVHSKPAINYVRASAHTYTQMLNDSSVCNVPPF